MKDINSLTIVFDMYGCPNRCKHCWIGSLPNRKLTITDSTTVANFFKTKFPRNFTFYSWMREPDYADNYKEIWELDNKLSVDNLPKRFELASFYRIVRDKEYVPWLSKLGVKVVQLTLFGLERLTNLYIGRKGAFNEIITATKILINNNITPRWQVFINQENKEEIIELIELSKTFDQEFELFIHEGSCDGENELLYPIRITRNDISDTIKPYYLNYDALYEEKTLYEKLSYDNSTSSLITSDVVFYVTNDFSVYPNLSNIAPWWKIGNIKENTVDEIIANYLNHVPTAMKIRSTIPLGEIVQSVGNKASEKLFSKADYIIYLLNQYARKTHFGSVK